MKKVFFCWFFSIAALGYLYSQPVAADFARLKWLEGTWTMSKARPGHSGNERWVKQSATEWQGLGVDMKGADTMFVETLKIILKEGNIYYVADVKENKEPVAFLMTAITDNSFVCENMKHDFPKKIAYEKNGNTLKAVISGDGKSIEYLFEKK